MVKTGFLTAPFIPTNFSSLTMAFADAGAAAVDPLLTLRRAVSSEIEPIPTKSPDASASDVEPNLAKATHLLFNFTNEAPISFELSAPTRFISSGNAVDLRSIYLAWQNKDATVTDYLAATRSVNADLADSAEGGVGGEVKNLIFAEKLDLITWLESAGDSEYIKPLAEDENLKAANREAAIARGDADTVMKDANGVTGSAASRAGQKQIDPRLQEIYNSERKMGDRNTCLRGIKPTVRTFPHPNRSTLTEYEPFPTLHTNKRHPGLQPRPQIRRTLPRPRLASSPGRSHRSPNLPTQPTHLEPQAAQQRAQRPPTRAHHPAVALGLVTAAHDEHPVLPRQRAVPAARHKHGDAQHPARVAHTAEHFVARAALHPRRHARPVQAGLLGPRRRCVHDGSGVAVQELQVAAARGAVWPCVGCVCGLEGRGGAEYGEGMGEAGG